MYFELYCLYTSIFMFQVCHKICHSRYTILYLLLYVFCIQRISMGLGKHLRGTRRETSRPWVQFIQSTTKWEWATFLSLTYPTHKFSFHFT